MKKLELNWPGILPHLPPNIGNEANWGKAWQCVAVCGRQWCVMVRSVVAILPATIWQMLAKCDCHAAEPPVSGDQVIPVTMPWEHIRHNDIIYRDNNISVNFSLEQLYTFGEFSSLILTEKYSVFHGNISFLVQHKLAILFQVSRASYNISSNLKQRKPEKRFKQWKHMGP